MTQSSDNPISGEYRRTTSSADYESWPWFQDYIRLSRQQVQPHSDQSEVSHGDKPLPLAIGLHFTRWVLETPEVRDIVYRRFIQDIYSDPLESSLLEFAVRYYCYKNDLDASASSALNVCFRSIASLLSGDLVSPESDEYRNRLAKSTWAFSN